MPSTPSPAHLNRRGANHPGSPGPADDDGSLFTRRKSLPPPDEEDDDLPVLTTDPNDMSHYRRETGCIEDDDPYFTTDTPVIVVRDKLARTSSILRKEGDTPPRVTASGCSGGSSTRASFDIPHVEEEGGDVATPENGSFAGVGPPPATPPRNVFSRVSSGSLARHRQVSFGEATVTEFHQTLSERRHSP